eukprot:120478-Rhodomonas_salina.3
MVLYTTCGSEIANDATSGALRRHLIMERYCHALSSYRSITYSLQYHILPFYAGLPYPSTHPLSSFAISGTNTALLTIHAPTRCPVPTYRVLFAGGRLRSNVSAPRPITCGPSRGRYLTGFRGRSDGWRRPRSRMTTDRWQSQPPSCPQ